MWIELQFSLKSRIYCVKIHLINILDIENHNAKDCQKERVWNLETNVSTHFSKGLWEEAGSNTKTTLQHILEQFHKVLESLQANEKSKRWSFTPRILKRPRYGNSLSLFWCTLGVVWFFILKLGLNLLFLELCSQVKLPNQFHSQCNDSRLC